MDTRPVLFLDSGIGGIPYCRYFLGRNPGERVVYLADRQHFPYGRRDRNELTAILTALVEKVIAAWNPKIAVLACNTATVSALAALREYFPGLPFVGTVPALKPAALASKTGKVGVLGTERTIEDSYIRVLAAQNGIDDLRGIAAPALVEFVEHRLDAAGEDEKLEMARQYLRPFRDAGVDALVLGCTHFLFLLDEFRREARPDIAVFESIDGITRRIETLLGDIDRDASCAASGGAAQQAAEQGRSRLLLTGSAVPEDSWRQWACRLDFDLSPLEAACGV
ncbi:MAG: glutamate racemase [Treponema sp.]|jgi:glutamate racemase|nr:glutamate racemase [Treponema sp.]